MISLLLVEDDPKEALVIKNMLKDYQATKKVMTENEH